jgi:hypothetical protein
MSEQPLQQEILAYLHRHGPQHWQALCTHFADVPIGLALDQLKNCGHVTVTPHENELFVTLTKSGLTDVYAIK